MPGTGSGTMERLGVFKRWLFIKKKKLQGKCWLLGDFKQVTILTFIFLIIKYR